MISKSKDLPAIVSELASKAHDNFLRLGEALAQIKAEYPSEFELIISNAGIPRRKAYYMLEIQRMKRDLPIQEKDLIKLGWTKLIKLKGLITAENAAELVKMASDFTVEQLQQRLAGHNPIKKRLLQFRLTNEEYEAVAGLLVSNGAKIEGGYITNGEKGLLALAAANDGTPSSK